METAYYSTTFNHSTRPTAVLPTSTYRTNRERSITQSLTELVQENFLPTVLTALDTVIIVSIILRIV